MPSDYKRLKKEIETLTYQGQTGDFIRTYGNDIFRVEASIHDRLTFLKQHKTELGDLYRTLNRMNRRLKDGDITARQYGDLAYDVKTHVGARGRKKGMIREFFAGRQRKRKSLEEMAAEGPAHEEAMDLSRAAAVLVLAGAVSYLGSASNVLTGAAVGATTTGVGTLIAAVVALASLHIALK